jgi:hypothetical protein
MIHPLPWQSAPWPDMVDAIICDPPYSERTHAGHNNVVREGAAFCDRASLDYASIAPEQAREWGETWARRVNYWLCVMCDHVLWPHWEAGAKAAGLYTFPPVYCGISAMTVRVAADGPASWGVWMMVARTARPAVDNFGRVNGSGKPVRGWGSLPGFYAVQRDPGYPGGKPLELMRQIVGHYSHPGMLVADPCAGSGTTLVAARSLDRRWWGAEPDESAHKWAERRLSQQVLFDPPDVVPVPVQSTLL